MSEMMISSSERQRSCLYYFGLRLAALIRLRFPRIRALSKTPAKICILRGSRRNSVSPSWLLGLHTAGPSSSKDTANEKLDTFLFLEGSSHDDGRASSPRSKGRCFHDKRFLGLNRSSVSCCSNADFVGAEDCDCWRQLAEMDSHMKRCCDCFD